MKQTLKINGLNKLGNYLHQFLEKSEENYTPVSYTHLDVYKRQIKHRFFRNMKCII